MDNEQIKTDLDPQQLGSYRWSSVSVPKLDAAMAKAQGEMRAAKKNAKNPHLKSDYADLNSVIQACRGPLSNNGIARYQTPWTDDQGHLIVTTRLACEGEWVEADFECRIEQQKGLRAIQSVGNIVTYVKRYALSAMVGIATGEDDDGEAEIDSKDPTERWGQAVTAFASFGIDESTLLRLAGRTGAHQVTNADHEKLGSIYQGLRRGDPGAKSLVDAAQGRTASDDGPA